MKRRRLNHPKFPQLQAFLAGGTVIFVLLLGLVQPSAAETLRIGGTGADLGTMKQLLEAFANKHGNVRGRVMPSIGSGGGIKAVLAGKIDVAISTRPLKGGEVSSGATVIPYAKTALTIATPKNSPVDSITSADLVDIYAGRKIGWPDGSSIRLVLRPKSDSDVRILQQGVAGMEPAMRAALKRRGLPVGYTDQDAAAAIERSRWGLGTASLSMIMGENRPLKALTLDGVHPTPETIAEGRYPMVKTLYFVLGKSPSTMARKFVAFTRSTEGGRILSRTGHLALAHNAR